MNIFLDANVLVSVLNKEYPLFTWSARVLSLADSGRFSLFTSPICLAIAFYFAEKKSGAQRAKAKIELLFSKIQMAGVDQNVVDLALSNKSIHDLEDGLEYYAALGAKCTCIITENTNDFHFSKIPVVNSIQFLETYN